MIKRIKQWFYNRTKIYIVTYRAYYVKNPDIIHTVVDSIWWSEKKAKKRVYDLKTNRHLLDFTTKPNFDPRVSYFYSHLNKIIQY